MSESARAIRFAALINEPITILKGPSVDFYHNGKPYMLVLKTPATITEQNRQLDAYRLGILGMKEEV